MIDRLTRAHEHRFNTAVPAIAHPALEAKATRLQVDVCSKTHALDASLYQNVETAT